MNYYNENDPHAAAWLGNLMDGSLIPKGFVDVRSIKEVQPADLAGFRQCHFFAGIGGWSEALRLAGWQADQEVWTGSCPCQPFSAAGKRQGESDPRHLWPEFHRLIAECRPAAVIGEQVASKAGREWFARVRSDLEKLGYAVGAADLCAASAGTPHIRQRLFWVAQRLGHSQGGRLGIDRGSPGDAGHADQPEPIDGLADARGNGRRTRVRRSGGSRGKGLHGPESGADGQPVGVADAGQQPPRDDLAGSGARASDGDGEPGRHSRPGGVVDTASERQRPGADGTGRDGTGRVGLAGPGTGRDAGDGSTTGRVADAECPGVRSGGCGADGETPPEVQGHWLQRERIRPGLGAGGEDAGGLGLAGGEGLQGRPGQRGFWGDSQLIPCSDGKARRTQSGLFPLVDGFPFRLADGRTREGVSRAKALRGIGNAIEPHTAAVFIQSFMETQR